MKNKAGGILRGILVVLMAATTAMTLLGAVGTACLAWNGDKYGAAFKWIVPYMPTYQNLVYVSLAAGVAATLVCYAIARGDRWFYIGGLITLLVAGGAVAVQMYYTSELRDIPFMAAAPANVRLIITVITLVAFVIIRMPGVWNKYGFDQRSGKPGSPMAAGGAALIVTGLLVLSAPLWAGPTHMVDGQNMVETLGVPLLIDGVGLVVAGCSMLALRKKLAALWPAGNKTVGAIK